MNIAKFFHRILLMDIAQFVQSMLPVMDIAKFFRSLQWMLGPRRTLAPPTLKRTLVLGMKALACEVRRTHGYSVMIEGSLHSPGTGRGAPDGPCSKYYNGVFSSKTRHLEFSALGDDILIKERVIIQLWHKHRPRW